MKSSRRPAAKNPSQTTHATTDPPQLLASSGFLLARLGMESRKRFARMLEQHALLPHHFGLLVALGEHGVLPQQQLSQIMGVDPRNAVPIIDELQARKLIARKPDPGDRRRYNVNLTAAGRGLMQDLRRIGAAIEQEMFKSLSEPERSSLHSLLVKLYTGIGAGGGMV